MGGLISRWRIQRIDSGDTDVGKLIMAGTPNHGAKITDIKGSFVTGTVYALLYAGVSKSDPDAALNQMEPGSPFLGDLNGGNNHWYDVVLYNSGVSDSPDSIADNTQYYVLGSVDSLTLDCRPPDDLTYATGIAISDLGDFVVPYFSAMIQSKLLPINRRVHIGI
jgi:hypothetical protein